MKTGQEPRDRHGEKRGGKRAIFPECRANKNFREKAATRINSLINPSSSSFFSSFFSKLTSGPIVAQTRDQGASGTSCRRSIDAKKFETLFFLQRLY